MIFNLQKNQKAFTIIEMLVVVTIFATISALVMANFHKFDKSSVLDGEADKLYSILRQAQILSLTGQTIAGQRYNYGVHFLKCSANCSYILFADLDGDNIYDSSPEEKYGQGTYSLSKNIYIENLSPITVDDKLDIIFEAPLENTYFNNSQSQETATIILKHSSSSLQKTISVNRISNQIDIY